MDVKIAERNSLKVVLLKRRFCMRVFINKNEGPRDFVPYNEKIVKSHKRGPTVMAKFSGLAFFPFCLFSFLFLFVLFCFVVFFFLFVLFCLFFSFLLSLFFLYYFFLFFLFFLENVLNLENRRRLAENLFNHCKFFTYYIEYEIETAQKMFGQIYAKSLISVCFSMNYLPFKLRN